MARLNDRSVALALFLAGLVALVLSVPGVFASAGPPPVWVLFGWGTPVVVGALLLGGLAMLFAERLGWEVRWWAAVAGELFFLAVSALSGLATFLPLAAPDARAAALDGAGTGLLGYALTRLLTLPGSDLVAWLLASLLLIASAWLLWLTLPPTWTSLLSTIAARSAAVLLTLARSLLTGAEATDAAPAVPSVSASPDEIAAGLSGLGGMPARTSGRGRPAKAATNPTARTSSLPVSGPAPAELRPGGASRAGRTGKAETLAPVPASSARQPARAEASAPRRRGRPDYLPPLEVLRADEEDGRAAGADVRERAQTLKQTLAEFGVPVEVVSIKEGPTVTQFGLEPGEIVRELRDGETLRRRVSVATIMRLSNDLALALSAASIRIEAPVPGRPYVGVEVPNSAKDLVTLRGILETRDFVRVNNVSPLAIALGRDVAGDPVVADLSRMPHLLIAGATGSGKSVCINAIVTALLMNNGPETVRFLMIDPKMVELPAYNGIPHLLGPVITDSQQATGALAWLALQMDDRYRAFAAAGARNIQDYNRLVTAGRRGKARNAERMPYIILVIDELADLMMTAAYDVERLICRLAQMARATGIHLILATQRPSVDVVTGLIKANFPSRVAFAVTSQIDSRVILDTPGAEKLLGRGDMLYMAPDSAKLVRIQGCYVSDKEIDQVVGFWRSSQAVPENVSGAAAVPPWTGVLDRMEERDDLLEKALDFLQTKKTVSTSLLQRHLRIGYPRAARLMEQLEEMGAVGPDEGGGRSREVLARSDGDGDRDGTP